MPKEGTSTPVDRERYWQKNKELRPGSERIWAGNQKKTSKHQRSEILEQHCDEILHGAKQIVFKTAINKIKSTNI